MPSHRLVVPALVLLAAACGPPNYEGPARFPAGLHAHAAELVSLQGDIHGTGAGYAPAPIHPKVTRASCVDAAVCEVEVRDGRVLVGGKAAGRTEVVVEYAHPVTKQVLEARVPVTFAPPRPLRMLEVGPRVEPGADDLVALAGPGGVTYACVLTALDAALDAGHVMRGMTRAYACTEPVKLSSGGKYHGAGTGAGEGARALHVCVHETTAGANPTALWIYEGKDGGQAGELLEVRGERKDVCARK